MLNNIKNLTYKLLKKSENFFQTDMIYLAKGGFWLTLGQIVSSLSSFFLAIAFANLLPKEIYGTYKYILSIIGLLSIFTLSGINTALTRSVARGYEGSIIPAIKEKIKWGCIGSFISLVIAIYYYINGNITLTICFIIATIFLPLMDSFNIYINYLHGKKNFKLATKYNILTQIISSFLIISVLAFFKNLFLILFTYFISYTSIRFIFFKLTTKTQKLNTQIESDTISYGKHLTLMTLFSLIAAQIDKIFLFHFLGANNLAIYSIALSPPEQIRGLAKNVNALAFPKLDSKKIEVLNDAFYKKMKKGILITILITLVYILLSPFFYKIFFIHYIESIRYSQIYSISLITTIPTLIITSIFQVKQKLKTLYQYNAYSSIFRIIITFLLILFLGIVGAVLSKLISNFFDLFFLYSKLHKE